MKRSKIDFMKYLIPLFALLFAGCSSVTKIGEYEGTDYIAVRSFSLGMPSIHQIEKRHRGTNPPPETVTSAAGNGIFNSAVQVVGYVGGAAALGVSWPEQVESRDIIVNDPPPVYGPPAPPQKPTTIGNSKNDRPFTHRK